MPTIETRGQSIYFEDRGTGLPVVLGHSFLCDGRMWHFQVPRLAETHRVVNLDLRGHGRSGRAEARTETEDLVGDVIAVLDHLEIERAVWAGLSIGGMVAMRAALAHPGRVAGLILLDTHAGAETLYPRVKYHALGLGARLVGIRPFLPAVMPLMFGATTRRQKRELVSQWEAIMRDIDLPSILAILRAISGRDSIVGRLGEIAVPCLVMVGEEDRTLPPSRSREIAAGLRDCEYISIPQAGHLSALEQPGIVTGAMLEFLARFERRS